MLTDELAGVTETTESLVPELLVQAERKVSDRRTRIERGMPDFIGWVIKYKTSTV